MNSIKVNHLGEDYSTIEIDGVEYEASLGLGEALLKITKHNKKVEHSLNQIMDYIHDGEYDDFIAMGRPALHIYKDIEKVINWLNS